jgi:hypothetical protein
MADSKSDLTFMVLLILILGALGVSNFVEANTTKSSSQIGQQFFALLYILFAVGLVVYKISHP